MDSLSDSIIETSSQGVLALSCMDQLSITSQAAGRPLPDAMPCSWVSQSPEPQDVCTSVGFCFSVLFYFELRILCLFVHLHAVAH